MSYPSQPPTKPASHPYPPAPYQNATSPSNTTGFAPPPAKRPRLSPDAVNGPVSFQGQTNGIGQHNNSYGSPAVQSPYPPSPFAAPQHGTFNTPQPYTPQSAQTWGSNSQPPTPGPRANQGSPVSVNPLMPPPPRPVKEEKEERERVEDIGDMLTGSGVNLKDEENYITGLWNNRQGMGESFATNQSTSFGGSTADNSFSQLGQGSSFPNQSPDSALAGTLGAVMSQEDVEAELTRKREAAARALAERRQHHLNNQFLSGNCLRRRMDARAYEGGVRIDMSGVYIRNVDPKTQVMVNGKGTEGIVAAKQDAKAESMLEPGVPYEHILSLVSLAAGERIRSLLDEAYGLARARQYGDHGRVVPPEFADIADGQGKSHRSTVVPESVSRSQWDGVNEDTNDGNERKASEPVETISFEGVLNKTLRDLAERDRAAERERIKKRAARKRRAEAIAAGEEVAPESATDTTTANPTANSTTPSTPAPTAAADPKPTKKEPSKKKAGEGNTTEAQLFNQSNQTAAMMAMGKRGKQYSWMTGGASNMPTNRFAKPAVTTPGGSGTTTPRGEGVNGGGVGGGVGAKGKGGEAEEERAATWGDWREDSVDGRGIQLRDWVAVLERDGRQRKALQRAALKLK